MLTNSIMQNSGSKKKICKMEVSYKKLTMGFQNYKDIKQAHLKNRVCQQSTEYKQNKQCTFQPRLSSKKSIQAPQQRRSLKKFLEDQDKYSTIKRQKIQQLRQEMSRQEEDQFKGKPSIDSVSHRISTQMSHSNENVFERLSKEKVLVHNIFQPEQMFSPKICMKSQTLRRQKDVSNLLYQDAQRRRQKQGLNFQQLIKKEFAPQINSNTNNLVIKKIYNEFIEKVTDENISPLLAINVISQIFNIDFNPNRGPEQQQLCQKVLSFIADTKTQSVNAEVLWNFIQTIVNGHLINSNFTEEQENQILQDFGYFYTSRLTKARKSLTPQRYSFKPKTLRSSEKMAQNHRQRTLSSVNDFIENEKVNIDIKNNSVKIEDLFIIQYMKKASDIEKKRIQKQNNQLQKCSFRPNLQLSTNSMLQTQKTTLKKVNLIVPRTTKAQQIQKRIKIKQKEEDIQNKQNQQRMKTMYETTTKRINSSTNRNKQNKTSKVEVKNIQKSVMRVTLARKNRELVNALNDRGYPSNVQNWQNFRKSMKKDIEKSSQKLLKGYNSLQKLNSSLLKTSTLLTSKQVAI